MTNWHKWFLALVLMGFVASLDVSPAMAAEPGKAPAKAEAAGDAGDDWDDEFEDDPPRAKVPDPFKGWNKLWFHFNDVLFHVGVKPGSKLYKGVVPKEVRTGLTNMFRNIAMPVRFTNDVLQGDFKDAGSELYDFAANSTVGLAGFIDVTEGKEDRNKVNRDFGLTLDRMGVGHGAFLTWPLLGPMSVRDTVGWFVDGYMDPLTYVDPASAGFAARAVRTVNSLSKQADGYDTLTKNSLDKYEAVKNAYLQLRAKQAELQKASSAKKSAAAAAEATAQLLASHP